MATKPKVTLDKSHIVELFCQSTNYTVFDAKWVPTSARFIVAGLLQQKEHSECLQ